MKLVDIRLQRFQLLQFCFDDFGIVCDLQAGLDSGQRLPHLDAQILLLALLNTFLVFIQLLPDMLHIMLSVDEISFIDCRLSCIQIIGSERLIRIFA